MHVHLHLSEREAHELGQLLHRGALPATLTWLKQRYHHVAPAVLRARLLRHGALLLGREPTPDQAAQLALRITESLTHALTSFVHHHQAELITAVQNPAQGLTFVFTFHVADAAALAAGHVPTPHVGVRAGHHDGPHPHMHHPAPPHRPLPPTPTARAPHHETGNRYG
jgi:hypothetical protein